LTAIYSDSVEESPVSRIPNRETTGTFCKGPDGVNVLGSAGPHAISVAPCLTLLLFVDTEVKLHMIFVFENYKINNSRYPLAKSGLQQKELGF